MDDFGGRLREERLRLGYRLGPFSVLGGVAAGDQQLYESGQRLPQADYLASIGRGGADLTYICLGIRSPISEEALTDKEAEVITNHRTIGRLEKQAVERILQSLAAQAPTE